MILDDVYGCQIMARALPTREAASRVRYGTGLRHPLTVLRLLADASAAIDDAMMQVSQFAHRDGHTTEEIARACRVPVKMLEDPVGDNHRGCAAVAQAKDIGMFS